MKKKVLKSFISLTVWVLVIVQTLWLCNQTGSKADDGLFMLIIVIPALTVCVWGYMWEMFREVKA